MNADCSTRMVRIKGIYAESYFFLTSRLLPLFVGRCPTLNATRPLALPFSFSPFLLLPFTFLLSPFHLSTFPFSLSPFTLSTFTFLLFPFTFLLLASIVVRARPGSVLPRRYIAFPSPPPCRGGRRPGRAARCGRCSGRRVPIPGFRRPASRFSTHPGR